MKGLLAGLLLAIALGASPARGAPLLEKDDHTINLDGAFKSFFFGMHMPHHSQTILTLLNMPKGRGAMAIADLRLILEGEHYEKIKWQFHFRSQPLISSFPNALGAMSTATSARPARLFPLQSVGPDDPTFQWNHEVDRLNVQLRFGKVDVIVGRQAISFGVGFVWQPADLVGTFSPLELDRSYKPGVDALRVNFALSDFTELALVFAAGGPNCRAGRLPSQRPCADGDTRLSFEHSVAVLRLRATVGSVDMGGIMGWVRGDLVAGAFITASPGRFRLRSEVVLTYDIEEDLLHAGAGNPQGDHAIFLRGVFGLDYRFDTKKPLFLMGEIYYNGFGSRFSRDYATLARKPRVAEFGEVGNLGMLYAAIGLNWEPHHKLPVALSLMANLTDPSMHLSLSITYKLGDESQLVAGAYIPIGKTPALDFSNPGVLAMRSEFGLYPYLYYLIWKLHF